MMAHIEAQKLKVPRPEEPQVALVITSRMDCLSSAASKRFRVFRDYFGVRD